MLSVIKQSRWLLAIFIAFFASLTFGHGMSEAEKQIIIEGGNLRYIWIGATHMLSGYDHLAFVFGIIFFLTKFKDIVKYITAFTVGHSLTLIFATFNAIQINYFLIDAVIALSVCYIAFHNLDGFKKYLNIKAPNMLAMIFSLGLIHGLGLSTRLQQLPLNPDQLLMNIISFNLGIELGQIFALAIMLLLISTFRKRHLFRTFSKISNYFLILAGVFLFLMQMHGYEHTANAEEISTMTKQEIPSTETLLKSTHDTRAQQTTASQQAAKKDTITIVIPAKGDKEYKLQFAKGASFDYSWQTDKGELFFDFHGEPKGDTTGYFKTFEKDTKSSASGSLTTEFEGTHGWYWKNNTADPVVIILNVSGEYKRLDQ
jgi:hypothetical protein